MMTCWLCECRGAEPSAGRRDDVYRTIVFLSYPLMTVAVGIIWRWMYDEKVGLFNFILRSLGLIDKPIPFLQSFELALPSVLLANVWQILGFYMIILLAGLQAIPVELYEAARIDGASAWRQLRHITLPMLGPTLLMVAILTVSGYFQLFAEPYVMTEGGPLESTTSVLYLMYEDGFKWWNLGTAAAEAFLLFLVMLAVTAAMLRLSPRERTGEAA